jgi:dUTP pyrophosphatase
LRALKGRWFLWFLAARPLGGGRHRFDDRDTERAFSLVSSHLCPAKVARILLASVCTSEYLVFAMSAAPTLSVKRLSPFAALPVRASSGAAGYDLASAHTCTVKARGRELVRTDLAFCVPAGTYGRIAPRSGLAWKSGIDVGAGVIDWDYRGPVGVLLFNHSDADLEIARGDRVAQLILERIELAEVREIDDLDATHRGAAGFGSSGSSALPPPRDAVAAKSVTSPAGAGSACPARPSPAATATPAAHK